MNSSYRRKISEACKLHQQFKAIANSNHFPNITRKKTLSKIVDTDFPSLKLIIKAPANDTNYTSAALHYKRALLKGPITPTKNKEYLIVGATNITCNDGTNEKLCQGWKHRTTTTDATK